MKMLLKSQMNINSVDPDEIHCSQPSHLDLKHFWSIGLKFIRVVPCEDVFSGIFYKRTVKVLIRPRIHAV